MPHSPSAKPPYLGLDEAGKLMQRGNELRVYGRMLLPEQEGPMSAQEVIQAYRSAQRESMFAVIRPEECLGHFSPQDVEIDSRHQGVVDQFFAWTEALQRKIDGVLEVAATPIPEPRVLWGNKEEKKKEWAQQMQARMAVQGLLVKLEKEIMEKGPAALADKIRAHIFNVQSGDDDVLEKIWVEALAMYYAWFTAVREWEHAIGIEEDLEGIPSQFQSQEYVEEQLTRIFGEQVSLAPGQETSEE